MYSPSLNKKYFRESEKKALHIFTKRNTDKGIMLQRLKTDWPVIINSMELLSRLIPLFIQGNKRPVIHEIYESILYKHDNLTKENKCDNEKHNILIEQILSETVRLGNFKILSSATDDKWTLQTGQYLDVWASDYDYEIKVIQNTDALELESLKSKLLLLITTVRQRELIDKGRLTT